MLEWSKDLEIDTNIIIHGSINDYLELCKIDNKYRSNLITGVDYIDEFPMYIYIFKILGLCGIKDNGLVTTLRTDGLPVFGTKPNIVLEIYQVENSSKYLDEYLEKMKLLKELSKQMEQKTKIEICDKAFSFPDLGPGQMVSYDDNGNYVRYTYLDGYKDIEKEQNKLEENLRKWTKEKTDKCRFIYKE